MTDRRMKATPYRHELNAELQRASLDTLLGGLQPGQAISLTTFPPYWDVCARRGAGGRPEYFVTDCSVEGVKPRLVHGPEGTRAAVEEWARGTQLLWLSTHVQFAADDIGLALGRP